MSSQETSLQEMDKIRGDFAECAAEYRLLDYLGSGAYGTVCSAVHVPSSEKVAIKKCKNVFKSRTIAKRTLREVRILRYLSHPNIIVFKGLMPSNDPTYDDLYLLFELMETDLSQIIRSPQELCIDHVQYFMLQLFSAVSYLHEGNVVHRDIKPKNIMVNADCTIKLADFGLARVMGGNPWSKQLAITDYVTTRWYRAPEVLAGWSSYGSSVDMWALGCILIELINRAPLFPGSDSLRQLEKIVAVLGRPEQSFINKCLKYNYRRFLQAIPSMPARMFKELAPNASADAIDLAERLLVINPTSRLSGKQCLQHRFIAGYAQSNGLVLPIAPPLKIPTPAFDHEAVRCELDVLRKEIADEMSINAVQHTVILDFESSDNSVEKALEQPPQPKLDQPEISSIVESEPTFAYQSLANCSDSHENSDDEGECKSVGTEVLHYALNDKVEGETVTIQATRMLSSSTVQTMQEDYMIGLVSEDASAVPSAAEVETRRLSPIVENSHSEKSSDKSSILITSPSCDKLRGRPDKADGDDRIPSAAVSKASLQSFSHADDNDSPKDGSTRHFSFSSMSSKSLKRRMSMIRQQAAAAECEVCSFGLSFLSSRNSVQKKSPNVLKKLIIPNHSATVDIQPSIGKDKVTPGNPGSQQVVARSSRARTSSCTIM